MHRILRKCGGAIAILMLPVAAGAQAFETLGTRAAGMGGAFVAVADDASAVYWNPAGLASGSYFSLLLDRIGGRTSTDDSSSAGSRSAYVIAAATPALGLSYYRLRATTLRAGNVPAASDSPVRVETLVTHQAGVTVVQSLVQKLAIGATVKLVRGIAASELVAGSDRDRLLDDAGDLIGTASNRIDADLGVMAAFGTVRAGLTVRNLTEPKFDVAGAIDRLRLPRQIRAGLSLVTAQEVLVALDIDLRRIAGLIGDERNVAVGAEARVFRRAFARAGFRVNTLNEPQGRTPAVSLGGSFVARASLLLDAQVTSGSDRASRGWGLAARVLF